MKYTMYLALIAVLWAIYNGIKLFVQIPDIGEADFNSIAQTIGNLLLALGLVYNDVKTSKLHKNGNGKKYTLPG